MPGRGDRAVVLVSGGMDSCVVAAIAGQSHRMAFLHVNYGQRTEERELRAFHDLAEYFEVADRLVVDFRHLAEIGGSSLTDPAIPVPRADRGRGDIPSSYVPFRNAQMLSAAVSWAEVIGAGRVFIGAVEEDSSGYPDCRRAFYEAFNDVIALGTKVGSGLRIETPIIGMTKAGIVRRGFELEAPFHLTWSCYVRNDEACGECDSCALRLRGFRLAGIEDPIPYVRRPVY